MRRLRSVLLGAPYWLVCMGSGAGQTAWKTKPVSRHEALRGHQVDNRGRVDLLPWQQSFICQITRHFPVKRLSVKLDSNGFWNRLDPAGAEGTCQFPVDAHLGNLSGIWSKLRHRQPSSPPAQLCRAKWQLRGLKRRVLQKCRAAAGGCFWKNARARRRRSEGKCPEEGLTVAVLLLAGLGGRKLLALWLLSSNRQFERRRRGQPFPPLQRAPVKWEQPETATYPAAFPHCPAALSQHATVLRPHPHGHEKSAWEQAPPPLSVPFIWPQEAFEQG